MATGTPAVAGSSVEIVVTSISPIAPGTRIEGRLEAVSVEGDARNQRILERSLRLPGSISLDLDLTKVWRLTYHAEGFWTERRTFALAEPGQTIRLTAWPTGTIKGTVTPPRGERLPAELAIRFEPSEDTPIEGGLPRTIVRCPIENGQWSCEIPAFLLDLRLRATGFVSHFFWNVDLRAGEVRRLGNLRLRRGASVVGRVTALEGALSPECTVHLMPMESGETLSQSGKGRLARLAMKQKPDERGFFHFSGIQPGSYRVSAEQEGSAPARIFPVTVMENAETELSSPLELAPPLALEVVLTPALDISNRPFKVEVLQLSPIPGLAASVFEGRASEEGRFMQEGLEPSRYVVIVKSSTEDKLATELFHLNHGNSTLEVTLSQVAVEGTLRLGEEPLSADVVYGGPYGMERAALAADKDGQYFGLLPREGEWLVYVAAEEPRIRRLLTVDVEPRDGVALVDIELPPTLLSGEVVDAEGVPVAGALVRLIDPRIAEEVVQHSDEEGRFVFEAAAEGRNILRAEHLVAGTSPKVEVDLVKNLDPGIRLTLRQPRTISGKVSGTAGPVPGARILTRVYGDDGPWPLFLPTSSAMTDVGGAFELEIPLSAQRVQLVAMPPGYALKALPVMEIPEEPVLIQVDQAIGAVIFELDEAFIWEEKWRPRPGLWIDGVPLDRFILQHWAHVNSVRNQGQTEYLVPALPPGRVTACWSAPVPEDFQALPSPSSEDCQEGFLGPSGELRFRFGESGDDKSS